MYFGHGFLTFSHKQNNRKLCSFVRAFSFTHLSIFIQCEKKHFQLLCDECTFSITGVSLLATSNETPVKKKVDILKIQETTYNSKLMTIFFSITIMEFNDNEVLQYYSESTLHHKILIYTSASKLHLCYTVGMNITP